MLLTSLPIQFNPKPHRGASLTRNCPSLQGHHLALGIILLYGPRRARFLMSEVPLCQPPAPIPRSLHPALAITHSGARTFHQKSTCLTQLTLGSHVVQIWSRFHPSLEETEPAFIDRGTLTSDGRLYATVWLHWGAIPRPPGLATRSCRRIRTCGQFSIHDFGFISG